MQVQCDGCDEIFTSTDEAIVHVEDYPVNERCTYENMREVDDDTL